MKTIKLIEAIPASGKTRAEVEYIAASTHNRFLYVCKGLNQVDDLATDVSAADPKAIVTPFKSKDLAYGYITEVIEKYVRDISPTDTNKHIVIITHKAFDMLKSVSFFEEANFHLSYDEKPEFVVDLEVQYDNQTKPEHIRVITDGKVSISPVAASHLETEYKLIGQKEDKNTLINFIQHPRYDVNHVTNKMHDNGMHEHYQAYIKENYFLSNTRILSYGLIGSMFHTYLTHCFMNTELTTETINYTTRDHKVTVIPMTEKRNTSYIQTHSLYSKEYERMMHKMFDLAVAMNGNAMSYVNKVHDPIANEYAKKGVVASLPNYLHGLNDYRDYDVLVSTFVSNRSPESIMGLTDKLGVDKEDALLERSRDALIQVAQRGVTRDYVNTGRAMTIFVVSLEDAEHIKATIPNVTIDMTQINTKEFTFKKVKIAESLTLAERGFLRNIKAKQKNDKFMESLPLKVKVVLEKFANYKGAKYKEALIQANLWDKFTPRGTYVG